MAIKAACARAFINVFYGRLTHTALSVHPGIQNGRQFVSVSQHYLSPQPPKKPAGAFFKFMKDKSSEINSKSPGVSLGERAKIGSSMWQDLDPEVKSKMKLVAFEEMQDYRQKYLNFLDGLTDQERDDFFLQKKTKRKTKADRKHRMELRKYGKPKMAPNPFMLFVRSSRLERGSTHPTKFVKSLVEYWKQMPQAEKEIYVEDSKVEKEKYNQEMKEWEERMKEMGREDLIRKKSQTKTRKVRATKAKTPKPRKKAVTLKKPKTPAATDAKSPSPTKKTSATAAKKPAAKSKATQTSKKQTISAGIQTEE